MYIRAKMDAYLDSTAGRLETLSAEPLRTWRVTGTDEAIEAFRVAVNGTVVPDEDIPDSPVSIAIQRIVEKTEQVAVLQASLDVATAELTNLQKVAVVEPVVEPVLVVQDVVQVAKVVTITKG